MKKIFVVALMLVAIAGSIFLLLRNPTKQAEASAVNISEALGETAAEEVAHLLEGKGAIVVLTPEVAPDEAPTFTAARAAFEQALKKHSIRIAADMKAPGGMRMLMIGKKMSPQDYETFLGQSPEGSVIVSFVGLPSLSTSQLLKHQATHPLVVVDVFASEDEAVLAKMVEAKVITMAFVSRTPEDVAQAQNQPKLFDRHYKILRATQ